eukprot:7800183-Pyramimonas_sp.AAC.1
MKKACDDELTRMKNNCEKDMALAKALLKDKEDALETERTEMRATCEEALAAMKHSCDEEVKHKPTNKQTDETCSSGRIDIKSNLRVTLTSFYGSSCANNGKGALNALVILPAMIVLQADYNPPVIRATYCLQDSTVEGPVQAAKEEVAAAHKLGLENIKEMEERCAESITAMETHAETEVANANTRCEERITYLEGVSNNPKTLPSYPEA